MKLTPREQVIAAVTVVFVLFFFVYRWGGLGSMLDDLSTRREQLANQREQLEEYHRQLRLYRAISDRYDRYAHYSLSEQEGDPKDVFRNYIYETIRDLGLSRQPGISEADDETIPDLRDYLQLLVTVDVVLRTDDLVRLLNAFAEERLLIRGMEIRAMTDTGESDLSVKITLARFIRAEDLHPEQVGEETAEGEASPTEVTP